MRYKLEQEDGLYLCVKCLKKKTLEEFHEASDRKSGHSSWCKQCYTERDTARRAEYNTKIAEIKLERGCVDCGYKEHPYALDFDHLPQFKKKFKLSQGHSRPWQVVLEEILKCEVRCSNCHRVKTFERQNGLYHYGKKDK